MAETIFITGANRGIGLALTHRFLAEGHQVTGTARTSEKAQELASRHKNAGEKFTALVLDVTDDASVLRAAESLLSPVIDVLINNAAVFPEEGYENLEELDLAHLTEAFETNVVGVVRVTRAFLPQLRKSSNPRVVNISSTAGSIWQKYTHAYYAYATSKAALNMITRSMAFELKEQGIVMAAVSPGWVKTEMGGTDATLTPEESAAALAQTCGELAMAQSGTLLERDGKPSPAAW